MDKNELESMVNYIAARVDIPVLQVWRYYNETFKKSAKKIQTDYSDLTDKSIDESYRGNRAHDLKEKMLGKKISTNHQEEVKNLDKFKSHHKTILDGKYWTFKMSSLINNDCFLCAEKILRGDGPIFWHGKHAMHKLCAEKIIPNFKPTSPVTSNVDMEKYTNNIFAKYASYQNRIKSFSINNIEEDRKYTCDICFGGLVGYWLTVENNFLDFHPECYNHFVLNKTESNSETSQQVEQEPQQVEQIVRRTIDISSMFNEQLRDSNLQIHNIEGREIPRIPSNDKTFLISDSNQIDVLIFDTTRNTRIRFFGTGVLTIKKFGQQRRNRKLLRNIQVSIKNFEPFNVNFDKYIVPEIPELTKKLKRHFMKPVKEIGKLEFEEIIERIKNPEKFPSEVSERQIQNNPETKITDNEVKHTVSKSADIPLKVPDTDELNTGIKEIQKELLIEDEKIQEIVMQLKTRHVILTGAIGTGKTEIAKLIPQKIWHTPDFPKGYEVETYTATSEWTTSEVLSGTFPKLDNDSGSLQFEEKLGCVTKTINKHTTPTKDSRGTWLLIDEFNRADIDKAFGQLFTGLASNEIQHSSQNSDKKIPIPKDFRILGTMNTNDKTHLYQISDALKRRFAFVEIPVPSVQVKDKEMSIALEHALKINDIEKSQFSEHIVFEKDGSVDFENSKAIGLFTTAYVILAIIRSEKPLGTAILTGIYQNLITGLEMKLDSLKVLDSALKSALTPQLEQMSSEFFNLFLKFFETDEERNIYNLMSKISREGGKEKYEKTFSKLMSTIGINNLELADTKDIISEKNKNTINEKWDNFSANVLWENLTNLKEFKESVTLLNDTYSL